MDSETVKILIDGLVEIVKILGPAIIAALVAYKAGMWQVEAKLREMEKGHTFSAAEKLFDYYRDREKELAASHKSINESMGFLLGMTSGSAEDDESTKEIRKLYDLHVRVLPNQVRLTLRDLKKYQLDSSEEYGILAAYVNPGLSFNGPSWGDNVFKLLEVYGYLQMCNQMILENIAINYLKVFSRET